MTTLFHLTWSDYVPAIIKEGLKLFADKAKGEHYEGDYWTRQAIASERISV